MKRNFMLFVIMFIITLGIMGCDFFQKTTTSTNSITTSLTSTTTSVPTSFVVSFNANGGTEVPQQNVVWRGKAILPITSKMGYVFGGWYTNPDCTSSYSFNTIVTSNLTLYAKWIPIIYTLTIQLEPDNILEIELPYGTTLNSLEGYLPEMYQEYLLGWYHDENFSISVSPNDILTGNLTIFPKFEYFLYVTYHQIDTLYIKQRVSDYYLSVDGHLYSEGTYEYNLDLQKNGYFLKDITNRLNLSNNETILKILEADYNTVIFITSTGRAMLYGNTDYEAIAVYDDTLGDPAVVDLTQYLGLNSNEQIESAILSDFNVIFSTNQQRVLFWGVTIDGNFDSREYHELLDLSLEFNLNVGEKFVQSVYYAANTTNYTYQTNQRIFVTTVGMSDFTDNIPAENEYFFDANLILDNDNIVYLYYHPNYEITYISQNGHFFQHSDDTQDQFLVSLDADETIESFIYLNILKTSKGRYLQMNHENEYIDLTEVLLNEGETIVEILELPGGCLILTSDNRNLYGQFGEWNNVTTRFLEMDMTIDQFVESGSYSGFIKDGLFYHLTRNGFTPDLLYQLSTLEKLYTQESASIDLLNHQGFLTDGWMDEDGQMVDNLSEFFGTLSLYPHFLEPLYVNFLIERFNTYISYHSYIAGTIITESMFLDEIPYGYQLVSLMLDGQTIEIGSPITSEMNGESIELILSELEQVTLTVEINYEDGSNYDTDVFTIVIGDQFNHRFDYVIEDEDYEITGFYTDAAFTSNFDIESIILNNTILYAKIVLRPVVNITIIAEGYENLITTFYMNSYINVTTFYMGLPLELNLPEGAFISGVFYNQDYTHRFFSATALEDLTLYALISLPIMIDLSLYLQDGTFLSTKTISTHTNITIDQWSMGLIDEDLYGYSIVGFYTDSAMNNALSFDSLIDESITHYYIQVTELLMHTLTIHLIDKDSMTEIELLEMKILDNDRLFRIFTDLFDNYQFSTSDVYYDPLLQQLIDSDRVTTDMELYFSGTIYENYSLTIYYGIDNLDFITLEVNNLIAYSNFTLKTLIRSMIPFEFSSVCFFFDDHYLNQLSEYEFTQDTTLYAVFLDVQHTSTIATIISVDGYFETFTVKIARFVEYNESDIYNQFLSFLFNDSSFLYEFYVDEALTNRFYSYRIYQDVTIYVTLSADEINSVTVNFYEDLVQSQSFLFDGSKEPFDYEHLELYLFQIHDIEYAELTLYYDEGKTMLNNYDILTEDTVLYVEVSIPDPFTVTFLFENSEFDSYIYESAIPFELHRFVLFDYFNDLLINPFSKVIHFYSDPTFLNELSNIEVKTTQTIYVKLEAAETIFLTINFIGNDIEMVVLPIYANQSFPYDAIDVILDDYFGPEISFFFNWSTLSYSVLQDVEFFTQDTTLYIFVYFN